MSSYATTTSFKAYLGNQSGADPGLADQLSDRVGDPGTLDESVLQELLDSAEATIDAKLAAANYVVPVVVTAEPRVAAFLRNLTHKLAAYEAYAAHPMRETIPEKSVAMYEQAVALLDDIVDGNASLPSTTTLPISDVEGDVSQYAGDGIVFGADERGVF